MEVDLGVMIRRGNHVVRILSSETLIHPKISIPILFLNNFRNTSVDKVEVNRVHVEIKKMTMMVLIVVEMIRTGIKEGGW